MNDMLKAIFLKPRSIKIALTALLILSLAGCDELARFIAKPDTQAEQPVVAEEQPAPEEKKAVEKKKTKSSPLYEWKGDGRSVTRIVIDTNEQKARFYEGEEELGWATVATGVSKYPTPTGKFQVMEKIENKRSNLYGKVYGKGNKVIRSSVKVGRDNIPAGGRFEGARMPYWMRLTYDGIGLHAGAIPRPGSPASHGCIRMPSKIAPTVFKHVTQSTSVEIVGKGPDYGNYVVKQRAIAAEQKRAAEKQRIAARKAQEEKQAAAKQAEIAKTVAPPPAKTASPNETVETTAEAKDASTPSSSGENTAPRETRMRAPAETTAPTADTTPQQNTETPPSATPVRPSPDTTTPADPAPKPTPEPKPAPAVEKPAEKPTKPVLEIKEIRLPKPPTAEKPAPAAPGPAPAPAPMATEGEAQ